MVRACVIVTKEHNIWIVVVTSEAAHYSQRHNTPRVPMLLVSLLHGLDRIRNPQQRATRHRIAPVVSLSSSVAVARCALHSPGIWSRPDAEQVAQSAIAWLEAWTR